MCVCRWVGVCMQDPDTIRMQESLDLFERWANHPDFQRKPMVVAFTKKDIYQKTFDLEKFRGFFPDFEGTTADDGIGHVVSRLKALIKDPKKKINVRSDGAKAARHASYPWPSPEGRALPPAPRCRTHLAVTRAPPTSLPHAPPCHTHPAAAPQTFVVNTTDADDFFDMMEGLKEIVAKHNNAKIMDAVQASLEKKKGGGRGSIVAQGNSPSDTQVGDGGCCIVL